jgi:hypothetical protein
MRQLSIDRGEADLGKWGQLRLTGAESATVVAAAAADIELPETIAAELVDAGLVLNEETGTLLVLPYSGEYVGKVSLFGESPSVEAIPRDPEAGLRLADLKVVSPAAVIFLTERLLMCFGPDLGQIWRVNGDFLGWGIACVRTDELELVSSDWSGREDRQRRSLASGQRLD